jgi:hypothetical protein
MPKSPYEMLALAIVAQAVEDAKFSPRNCAVRYWLRTTAKTWIKALDIDRSNIEPEINEMIFGKEPIQEPLL